MTVCTGDSIFVIQLFIPTHRRHHRQQEHA